MRCDLLIVLTFTLAACSGEHRSDGQAQGPADKAGGGADIAIRSGADLPPRLPEGFTLYPDAKVTAVTLVERKGHLRGLVAFESGDKPAAIADHYRREARAVRAKIALDLAGREGVSLGGTLAQGKRFSLTVHRDEPTRAELAFE